MDFCSAVAGHAGYRVRLLVCRVVFAHPAPHRVLALSAEQRAVGRLGFLQRSACACRVAAGAVRDEHSGCQENRLKSELPLAQRTFWRGGGALAVKAWFFPAFGREILGG